MAFIRWSGLNRFMKSDCVEGVVEADQIWNLVPDSREHCTREPLFRIPSCHSSLCCEPRISFRARQPAVLSSITNPKETSVSIFGSPGEHQPQILRVNRAANFWPCLSLYMHKLASGLIPSVANSAEYVVGTQFCPAFLPATCVLRKNPLWRSSSLDTSCTRHLLELLIAADCH